MENSPVAISYVFVAALVVLTYDQTLTFDQEIRLVWNAPWNLAKALFLFIRYATPISMITLLWIESQTLLSFGTTCALDPMFFLTSLAVTLSAADLLLLLRIYAIWGRTWKVLTLMGTLWAATYVSFVIMFIEIVVKSLMSGPPPHFCYNVSRSLRGFEWASYTSSLLFDTTAFIMMVIRALMHRRTHQIREPLLQTFYGYGIGYFLCLTLLKAFCIAGNAGVLFTVFEVAMQLCDYAASSVVFRSRSPHECTSVSVRYEQIKIGPLLRM